MTSRYLSSFHRFAREAMAATYEILVDGGDSIYAGQATEEAFRELDRLEAKLSRFDETSDVSQINHAATGVPVAVGYDTFACIRLALFVSKETNGAFDVTSPDCDFGSVDLVEGELSVALRRPGASIDLGGIGKGYALDRMSEILGRWDVNRSLLIAGGSTVLAMDAPAQEQGWPIQFGGREHSRQLKLCHCSFSGSGLAVKGEHIVDPRSGIPVPARKRAWALAPTAALSDALSTAFMIMERTSIEVFCEKHQEIGWALELPDGIEGTTACSNLPHT